MNIHVSLQLLKSSCPSRFHNRYRRKHGNRNHQLISIHFLGLTRLNPILNVAGKEETRALQKLQMEKDARNEGS